VVVRRADPLTRCARVASLLLCGLLGCRRPQPMAMSLQDNWNDLERSHILHTMDRWREATNHIVLFVPSPTPFHDRSGEFDRSDLQDGVNVLYKIVAPTPDTQELQALSGETLLGYNFQSDVLVYWYEIGIAEGPHEDLHSLDKLLLHELGHHTGLGHIRTHDAIMNDTENGTCITEWDLQAFCEIYECRLSDMHPECDAYY